MRAKLTLLLAVLCPSLWLLGAAGSSWAAPIDYRQTMTKILQEDQFTGWPAEEPDAPRSFGTVVTSLNGSKIGFFVVARNQMHTYVANPSGSGIVDLTLHLPAGVDPYTVSRLQLDNLGERLFFRAPNLGSAANIYYFTLAANSCAYAVVPKGTQTYALNNLDFRVPYSLTTVGDQIALYFKNDAGWDPVAQRYNRGIYTATLGGQAIKVMDMDRLPGAQNMNFLSFLGSAAQSNQNIISWNQDYGHPPASAMWTTAGPTRVPDEVHNDVWASQDLPAHLISADGTKALYYIRGPEPRQLYLVDLASGAKTLINETTDLNGYFAPALAPSGKYAFFTTSGHKYTRHDLRTGDQRDTWAYWFAESSAVGSAYNVSDITANDRNYFLGSKEGNIARIHRIDMAPTNFGAAPNITAINFSAPRLLNDGTTRITVMATVSDAQGLGTISWVRMSYLVNGLEKPVWLVGDPLSYDFNLYDDGTNGGDQVAGDGIYTNNTIRTNPNSNFYQEYSLPHAVGLRIIARDRTHNYGLADTRLLVADNLGGDGPATQLLLLDD